jgi:hypothetical protein
MNGDSLRGVLAPVPTAAESVRLIALDTRGAVMAESHAGIRGEWNLSAPAPIASVIALSLETGIAAAWRDRDASASIALPLTHSCRVDFANRPDSVRLWVDPMSLDGFPDEHLPALRLHPDATFDLHLGNYPCSPQGNVIALQAGRYRISGGIIGFRPKVLGGAPSFRVSAVEDVSRNLRLEPTLAGYILPLYGDVHLRVSFERVEETA